MAPFTDTFDAPDRFVAGTIGEPGHRTFYLQAKQGRRLTTLLCEKQQVAVLADHMERILDELARLSEGRLRIPPALSTPGDLGPLDAPVQQDFRVGTIAIAWDGDIDGVLVEMQSAEQEGEDSDTGDPLAADAEGTTPERIVSVRLRPAQAREFIARSRRLVAAGRPACPFCSQPIDPEGHICPRANGYRRALFGSD